MLKSVMERDVIYLDNNATTPIDPRVLEKMMPFLTTHYANANSMHRLGVDINKVITQARKTVAELINAQPSEIIFTSGATESINLAIKGVAEKSTDKKNHIITAATEHSAVLDTCKYLETKGYEVTYLNVSNDGLVNIDELKLHLRSDTILVSIMYANNETGVIQPIQELAKITHEAGALFMSDATQAVGKIVIDVEKEDIDILCFSGHKLYAPKGIGVLYAKDLKYGRSIVPLLHGGGHENGYRSGTLNVPGIVALGEACAIARVEMVENEQKILTLRNHLETSLLASPTARLNGSVVNRMYNVSNIFFKGIDSEIMITRLSKPKNDIPIIAVSNGSACTAANIEPSHVLRAMGLNYEEAFSSIRFSLGKFNSKDEIDITITAVENIIELSKTLSV